MRDVIALRESSKHCTPCVKKTMSSTAVRDTEQVVAAGYLVNQ